MTLQQLHYVITIAEKNSLNKAAEALYISQPSLTSAVRELEKELGIVIFNRSNRGVSLTADGAEFIAYARQICIQHEQLLEKYAGGGLKKKFGVSSQHYSFAVKCFAEMVRQFNTAEYEFAFRETKTREVITDVGSFKSEIGILYMSDFNRRAIENLLRANDSEFHGLIRCGAYVFLHKKHPLSGKASLCLEDLKDYPCCSFEQTGSESFYFAEEILSTMEYQRTIRVTDRATMLNLMEALNGYTLCSGIICQEMNGQDFMAVPFRTEEHVPGRIMEIGYVTKRNMLPSRMGQLYLAEIRHYLSSAERTVID